MDGKNDDSTWHLVLQAQEKHKQVDRNSAVHIVHTILYIAFLQMKKIYFIRWAWPWLGTAAN